MCISNRSKRFYSLDPWCLNSIGPVSSMYLFKVFFFYSLVIRPFAFVLFDTSFILTLLLSNCDIIFWKTTILGQAKSFFVFHVRYTCTVSIPFHSIYSAFVLVPMCSACIISPVPKPQGQIWFGHSIFFRCILWADVKTLSEYPHV